MTAFVTGASGFIGSHVARALLARGQRVRALVRPAGARGSTANLDGLDLELVEGDVRDLASLRRGVAGCDVVYHCAADYRLYAAEPRELYETNVGGTCNVLRAAADAAVGRVVYTSSVGTLAPPRGQTPSDESARASLADMSGDYKRSKLMAEREVERWAARGTPAVILLPSTPVGERDVKPTPTGRIIVDFLQG